MDVCAILHMVSGRDVYSLYTYRAAPPRITVYINPIEISYSGIGSKSLFWKDVGAIPDRRETGLKSFPLGGSAFRRSAKRKYVGAESIVLRSLRISNSPSSKHLDDADEKILCSFLRIVYSMSLEVLSNLVNSLIEVYLWVINIRGIASENPFTHDLFVS